MNSAMQQYIDQLSRSPMCLGEPSRSVHRTDEVLRAINSAGLEITVSELAVLLGTSDTTVKKAAKILIDTGRVNRRIDGVKYFYSAKRAT